MKHIAGRLGPSLLGTAALAFGLTSQTLALPAKAQTEAPETLGGGTVADPAVGPAPSYGIGGPGMVLVKNWHFGTGGTIKNQADMNAEFQYHDPFGTFCNGFGSYGADTVAPDQADAINGQPVEGKDSPPVRRFTADSLRTFLTPLDGATLMDPNKHNTGCGSFVAKWKIPRGGLLLGRDIVWETRVRYKTPPYYWFGIWTCGNKWKWDGRAQGAEMDVVESFGYDNGGGGTNFDGRYWHSSAVANPYKDTVFYADWTKTMAQQGVRSYDASQYHIWTWVYKRDNSYAMFVDGIKVQAGSNYYWTFGNTAKDEPVDVDFLFDGGWGHTQVHSVDHTLPASAFDGKFYEWSYSRVYLSGGAAQRPFHGPHALPGTVQCEDYDTGGEGVGYHRSTAAHRSCPYRADDAGIEACRDGGYDVAKTSAGTFLSYIADARTALDRSPYVVKFRVASPAGGRFHLEGPDAAGKAVNLTGPVSVPGTGGGRSGRR